MFGHDLIIVFEDDNEPFERRVLHGLRHIIRELNRMSQQQDDVNAAIQTIKDVDAGLDASVGRIEQWIVDHGDTIDTSGLSAELENLRSHAAAVDTLVPAAQNPPPAEPPAGTAVTTDQFQPLYTVDGDENNDAAQWTAFPGYTTDDDRPLFTFVHDGTTPGSTAGGDGSGGLWHAYVGVLKAVVPGQPPVTLPAPPVTAEPEPPSPAPVPVEQTPVGVNEEPTTVPVVTGDGTPVETSEV